MNKSIIIGICGISRAGKSTIRKKLIERLNLNPANVFCVDSYFIKYDTVYDENIKDFIDNWEVKENYDIEKMYKDIIKRKEEIEDIGKVDILPENERIILVEGFLLFSHKELINLLNIKIYLEVSKEVAYQRRLKTKLVDNFDFYFKNYIWKYFFKNNLYFPNRDDKSYYIIDATKPADNVYFITLGIVQSYLS